MTIHCAFAAAKINLTLQVLGRRADGYHQLRSIIVFADIGDRLTLDPGEPAGVTLSGPFAEALGSDTLIDKAFALLRKDMPEVRLGQVSLQKNLPIAAGIGGGSADAAAALRLIGEVNEPQGSEAIDWQKIALALGADVPVCMASVPALMSGLGDIIQPYKSFPALPAVLVNAQREVLANKTARVFEELAAPDLGPAENAVKASELPVGGAELSEGELMAEMELQSNDLQDVCMKLMPAVGDVLAALETSSGCRLARLSGAGPTCFGLYRSGDAANSAAVALAQAHPQWWVKAVTLAGAPGSKIE